MVQFENSFTNFVQSNNYYENSTINEKNFETLFIIIIKFK